MKKRIVVDISQVVYSGTGSALYVENLIDACLTIEKYEFVFFCFAWRSIMPEKIMQKLQKAKVIYIRRYIPISFAVWMSKNLRFLNLERLLGMKFDLYFASDWIHYPCLVTSVSQVHDIIFASHPDLFPLAIRKAQIARFENIQLANSHIFASSQYTVNQLTQYFPSIPSQNINLLYPPFIPNQLKTKYLAKSNKQKPYFLFVGKIQERKNVKRMIHAFQKLSNNDYELLIVGDKSWSDIDENSLPSNIQMLGSVSEKDLAELYSHAFAFVFPSLLEGFGYPVLEAMSYDLPVLCASSSSLTELCVGKSAILFDPLDEHAMMISMQEIIQNSSLRKKLILNAHQVLVKFKFKNYVKNLLTNFNLLLDEE